MNMFNMKHHFNKNRPFKFSLKTAVIASLASFSLVGCVGSMNPTGGNYKPDYPYFITTKPMIVKKIPVPVGTRLTYEETMLRKGKQEKLLSEDKLTDISFPDNYRLNWGGVPVSRISQFFNTEMVGYSVMADFSKLPSSQQSPFAKLWKNCSDDLGITIKSRKDWSFNQDNIVDVESCSVIYQRYFKKDAAQQRYLDQLYSEMKIVNPLS